MRLGTVIGRVILSRSLPAFQGGRFLLLSPFSRENFASGLSAPLSLSSEPTPVIYDNLGGGLGQVVAFVEGREAAQPFDQPTPVDAISAALADQLFYRPQPNL